MSKCKAMNKSQSCEVDPEQDMDGYLAHHGFPEKVDALARSELVNTIGMGGEIEEANQYMKEFMRRTDGLVSMFFVAELFEDLGLDNTYLTFLMETGFAKVTMTCEGGKVIRKAHAMQGCGTTVIDRVVDAYLKAVAEKGADAVPRGYLEQLKKRLNMCVFNAAIEFPATCAQSFAEELNRTRHSKQRLERKATSVVGRARSEWQHTPEKLLDERSGYGLPIFESTPLPDCSDATSVYFDLSIPVEVDTSESVMAIGDLWAMVQCDPNALDFTLTRCKEKLMKDALDISSEQNVSMLKLGVDIVVHPGLNEKTGCCRKSMSRDTTLPKQGDSDSKPMASNCCGRNESPQTDDASGAAVAMQEEQMVDPIQVITPVVQNSVQCAMNASIDMAATINSENRNCNLQNAELQVSYELDPRERVERAVSNVLCGGSACPPAEIQMVIEPRKDGDCPSTIPIPVLSETDQCKGGSCAVKRSCESKRRQSSIPVRKMTIRIPVAIEERGGNRRIIPKAQKVDQC